MTWFEAVVISTLSGVAGTGLGGALACVLRRAPEKLLGRLLSFAAGLMIGVVCFELMPEAISCAGYGWSAAGVIAGLLMVLALEKLISADGTPAKGMMRTGLLIAAGIAAHNLPEGLAIGAGSAAAPELGLAVCAVIAMHDVPEGMAMGIPLKMAGVSPARIIGLAAASGLPTGVGGLAGFLVGAVSPFAVGFALALAGGAMLTITCGELLPEASRLDKSPLSMLALVAGFVLALAAVRLT